MGHQNTLHGKQLEDAEARLKVLTLLDLLKTQGLSGHDNEVRYRHTVDAVRQIWKTEGVAGFYKGLLPSLLGVSHVAVQFPLYERLKLLNRKSYSRDSIVSI